MSHCRLIIFIMVSLILFPLCSQANETAGDQIEVVDLIVEWTPGGKIIQVGDYTISYIGDILIDNGDAELLEAKKEALERGGLVKAILIGKDENGFWVSDKIIVFAGSALEEQKLLLSDNKINDMNRIAAQKNESKPVSAPPKPEYQSKKPRLVDGVWVN